MLDGWYCRTLANEQATQHSEAAVNNADINEESDTDSRENNVGPTNAVDYKTQYRYLKRKLKFLIYENEFFQDALRSNQRRLLKVSRDRAFLLDRLLQYEKPENTSSESDETEESSEDEAAKKRKLEQSVNGGSGSARGRKKKAVPPPPTINVVAPENTTSVGTVPPTQGAQLEIEDQQQGHMTTAELERHLSKQPVVDLMPERAPATVPSEMFSNEPSLDSESNEHLVEGSSPTHVAAEECVPMEYSN